MNLKLILATSILSTSGCFVVGGQSCGDFVIDPGELCDDGNNFSGDGCREDCAKVERCGDGELDASEVCDDGNQVNGDGCTANCNRLELCGDGILDPQEICDDGNTEDGDGCSAQCFLESCGDGIVDLGEECDDANLISGDGCDANCTGSACGNGIIAGLEECDDSNTTSGDGCDQNCTITACGNNIVTVGEGCDDGNTAIGDGCRADCTREICGDGTLDPQEECDDGNQNNNDACPNTCGVDPTDNDNDGFTEAQGDCDDNNILVSPDSFEVVGDQTDNDCDGTTDQVLPCDANLDANLISNFAKAMGLCSGEVTAANMRGPSNPQARAIISSFGANNAPFEGSSWAHLSTGVANALDHNQGTNFTTTFPSPVANLPRGCGTPSAANVFDYSELELQIRVPNNARSFSMAFQFFSSEYPTFRCNQFSDTFAVLLSSTAFTGNITLDALGNGVSLDSDFFQVCLSDTATAPPHTCSVTPTQTLQGTGYDLTPNEGGATLPLLTTAPVTPGELITLRVMIFDEGDGLLDSSVLLDLFEWHTDVIAAPNIAPF